MRTKTPRRINQPYAQKLDFLIQYFRLPAETFWYGNNRNKMWIAAKYTKPLTYPVEYLAIKVTFAAVAKPSRYAPQRVKETFLTQLAMAFGDFKIRNQERLWQPTWY